MHWQSVTVSSNFDYKLQSFCGKKCLVLNVIDIGPKYREIVGGYITQKDNTTSF